MELRLGDFWCGMELYMLSIVVTLILRCRDSIAQLSKVYNV